MLARSFLSPYELDITQRQFDVLVKVLHILERGEAKFISAARLCTPRFTGMDRVPPNPYPPMKFFNMRFVESFVKDGSACGTSGCILGWALHLDPGVKFDLRPNRGVFDDLFMLSTSSSPEYNSADAEAVTTEQAAQALSNYLTTGEPRWGEVLETPRAP